MGISIALKWLIGKCSHLGLFEDEKCSRERMKALFMVPWIPIFANVFILSGKYMCGEPVISVESRVRQLSVEFFSNEKENVGSCKIYARLVLHILCVRGTFPPNYSV